MKWITVSVASAEYEMSKRTLQFWCTSGAVKARKEGPLWLILRSSLERKLHAH